MSDLTEHEAYDALKTNLRSAIQHCKDLAFLPAMGETYLKIIHELEAIEGAARQVGHFRRDMRWQKFGFEMSRFRARIGDAIRSQMSRKIMLHMAGMMDGALDQVEKLRVAKTGRLGAILPKERPAPHRDTRPVHFSRTPGGVILPV